MMLQIWRKSIKALMSYSNFKKYCEKKKNTKKTRQALKAHMSRMAGLIQQLGMPHQEDICTEKNCLLLFKEC